MAEYMIPLEKYEGPGNALFSVPWELRGIANAMEATMYSPIPGRLRAIADTLEWAGGELDKKYNDLLDTTLKSTEQNTALMLKAVLAGCFNDPSRQNEEQ